MRSFRARRDSAAPAMRPERRASAVLRRGLGAVVLVALYGGSSSAQTPVPTGEGINRGRLTFFPSITFDLARDNNVLYQSTDLPEALNPPSGVHSAQPRLILSVPFGAGRFRCSYAPLFRNYTSANFTQGDGTSHFVDLDGFLQVGPSVRVTMREHYVNGKQELYLLDPGGELTVGFVPFRLSEPVAVVDVSLGARQGLSIIPRWSSVNFDNAVETGLYDYDRKGAEGRYNYRLSEVSTAYALYSADHTHQDREQTFLGDIDIDDRSIGIGVNRTVSEVVLTQLSGGWEIQRYFNSIGSNYEGPFFEGSTSLRLGSATQLEIAALYRPYQSYFANNNYYVSTGMRLHLLQQLGLKTFIDVTLWPQLNTYGDPVDVRVVPGVEPGSDANMDGIIDELASFDVSQGITRRDNVIRGDFAVGFQLRSRIRLLLGYNWERRDSNIVERLGSGTFEPYDYTTQRLYIRFQAGWL